MHRPLYSEPMSEITRRDKSEVVRFDADRKARFLFNLKLTGQLQRSAQEAGISPRTVRQHLKDDPDFKEAYDEAYEDFKEGIETEIMRRAIMGWEEPVYQQGVLAGTVRKYDSRLLELLAKRHIPAYKEKQLPTDGVPIGILVVPESQGADDWEAKHGLDPSKEVQQTRDAVPPNEEENTDGKSADSGDPPDAAD